MYKPFLLSLVLSGLGAGAVGADQAPSDVSVWRWSVSTILDSQRASAGVGALPAYAFGQRYQRYSAVGLPEAAVERPSR
jgi:hypothetical protein